MSKHIEITVEGMTCDGCAGKVRTALEQTDGVESAQVEHATGRVVVNPTGSVSVDDLEFAIDEAVEKAGYHVVSP